jgi:hypothetical protein
MNTMNTTKRRVLTMAAVAALLGWAGVPAGAYDYWYNWVVDPGPNVGSYSSLEILPSGQPCISYCDFSSHSLKYIECQGDNNWDATVVHPGSDFYAGAYSSLALRPNGEPAISYQVTTDIFPSGQLWYAWRESGVWTTEHIPGTGVYSHTSLAFLLPRSPVDHQAISCYEYYETPAGGGSLCLVEYIGGQWIWTDVDNFTAEDVGQYSSLAVQPTGEPAISYYDASHGDLRFAYRTTLGDWVYHLVDGNDPARDVGQYTSLAFFPPDHPTLPGMPAISYHDVTNKRLKFAWLDPNDGWQTIVVPCLLPYDVGLWTSLLIAPDGQPAISYFVAPLDARVPPGVYYASHTGSDLYTDWDWEVVDGSHEELVGLYTSLEIFPVDHPVLPGVSAVSYYDATNHRLKYALRHYCIGDLNCDGMIDFADINPFVLYLSNNAAWQAAYRGCPISNGDINLDGTFGQGSFGDINPFVGLMVECGAVGTCQCPGPITPSEGCHGG